MKIYVNGGYVNASEAKISVYNLGFLVGCGAFETMRAYKGKVFRAAAHLRRLNDTCAFMSIPFKGEKEWMDEVLDGILSINGISAARVRLTVTPGADYTPSTAPDVVLTAVPIDDLPSDLGWRACLSKTVVSSRDPLLRHKTTSYAGRLLERKRARGNGFDEALFLNEKGCLTEGSATNIFCVSDGVIRTPPSSEGLLPGVTRAVVREIAAESGIPLEEKPLSLEDLRLSGETFLTNSVIEIMPLVVFEGNPISNGRPGPLTIRIREAYRSLVNKELAVGS
ncbi:MAG: aminotransferase class IV [Bacillota bacterium]